MSTFTKLAIRFTMLRVTLFILALLVLFLIGLRSIFLVGLALVVSAIVSYPVARRQRDQLVQAYEERKSQRGR